MPTAYSLQTAFTYFQLQAVYMYFVSGKERRQRLLFFILLTWEVKSLTQCIWWWNLMSKRSLPRLFSLETDTSHFFAGEWLVELKYPYFMMPGRGNWHKTWEFTFDSRFLFQTRVILRDNGIVGGNWWPHSLLSFAAHWQLLGETSTKSSGFSGGEVWVLGDQKTWCVQARRCSVRELVSGKGTFILYGNGRVTCAQWWSRKPRFERILAQACCPSWQVYSLMWSYLDGQPGKSASIWRRVYTGFSDWLLTVCLIWLNCCQQYLQVLILFIYV